MGERNRRGKAMPRVTVVIATYNYGQYLAGAVESVLAQSFDDYEVVVVDDGSTDDTDTVIEPFLSHPKITLLRTDHLGQPAAKNAGIRRASGDLIAFLDADDLWLPDKLSKQTALFDRNPELGVAYTRRYWMNEHGERFEKAEATMHRGQVLGKMFQTNFVCFSSCMVHRRVFDRVGTFDEQIPLAIDYDLWLRVARFYDFDYVDEPLVEYRTGHSNLSRRAEERLSLVLGIMHRFLEKHDGRRWLTGREIRIAFAETFANLGYMRRSHSPIRALNCYLRSLVYLPTYGQAWRGMLALAVPERGRAVWRDLFGRRDSTRLRAFARPHS